MDQSYFQLFQTGKEFDQIRFLDNFWHLGLGDQDTSDICRALSYAIGSSPSLYVRRTALKILCKLAISEKTGDRYTVLGIMSNLLSEGSEEEMQSVALKYLHHFPEASSQDFQEKLKELSDSPNGEVAGQACFCLGICTLSATLRETDGYHAMISLADSETYFKAASASTENRVDADFFLLFIRCARSIFVNDNALALSLFDELSANMASRSLYELYPHNLELEYLVFSLIKNLKEIMEIADTAIAWTETLPSVRSLFELRLGRERILAAGLLNKKLADKLCVNIIESAERRIFAVSLKSEKYRLLALQPTVGDSGLKDFLDHLISLFPDEEGPVQEDLELLAMLSENLGAVQGQETYQKVRNKEIPFLQAVGALLKNSSNNALVLKTGSIQGQEVLFGLIGRIRQLLPEYPEEKLAVFADILEEVIRYARHTLVGHSKKSHGFLFCKAEGGKGQDALEQDLQDNMLLYLEHSRIADGLEHEKAKFVDGGRVDIVYKKDLVTVPIELKKTLIRPDSAQMEQNYVAQAQTYTSGYDQLGIFVLLELSEKSTAPPANFRDWFWIHHIPPSTDQALSFPDYVVSVVIPGNRTSPSSKSKYA